MYNIKLIPTDEVKIELVNNTILYSCRQYEYCYLDFNHIRKEITKDKPNAKKFFHRILDILTKMELDIIGMSTVYSRNWNIARIEIDGVSDAVVLYYDKYNYKIRINIESTKTKHHFVDKLDSENILRFISRDVYDEQIRVKIKQLHKLQDEIKQLKNKKEAREKHINFSRMFSEQ